MVSKKTSMLLECERCFKQAFFLSLWYISKITLVVKCIEFEFTRSVNIKDKITSNGKYKVWNVIQFLTFLLACNITIFMLF